MLGRGQPLLWGCPVPLGLNDMHQLPQLNFKLFSLLLIPPAPSHTVSPNPSVPQEKTPANIFHQRSSQVRQGLPGQHTGASTEEVAGAGSQSTAYKVPGLGSSSVANGISVLSMQNFQKLNEPYFLSLNFPERQQTGLGFAF